MEAVPHRLKSAKGSDVVAILYELACACLKTGSVTLAAPDFQSTVTLDGEEEEEGDNELEEEYEQIPAFNWEQEVRTVCVGFEKTIE